MKCLNCQTINPGEAKFCMNCGTSLAESIRPTERGIWDDKVKSQSLDKFIPPELMAKIEAVREDGTMVGERRVITMLFCDVIGSTAAAEKVDPEVWADIMNGIFETMIGPIYKYEGTVPRLMGDAILAFFGAPVAHEDDPRRAVLAALEIQAGIQGSIEEIHHNYGLPFALRIGINTGLVVVGAIGSDLRMEYTAIGDAINLAARMEQTAAPGTVQISADTYRLVAPFFEFEALGELEVKGKADPIKTYRPLVLKTSPGHLRGLKGFSSPLIGRESQLSSLKQQLKQLNTGTGSFVAVMGEAGIGKSALIAEFKKSEDLSGTIWLRGEAVSYARSISYYPWREIMRQSVDAQNDGSPSEVRGKLCKVCDGLELPSEYIPLLEAILVVESEASLQVVAGFQGEALVQKMIEAAKGYLSALARAKSCVIVFDDLHWTDDASLKLLLGLVDLTQLRPVLFICMLRPDKTAASWDAIHKIQRKIDSRYHAITLEPLREEQTDTLLANLLGVKGIPKNFRDSIIDRADGNPFFIEELIRSLIETKQIIRENNQWRAVNEDARISLPDSLRGVLGTRIDRLPERSKHVLQKAAVIGHSFDLHILKQLTNLNGGLVSQIQYLQEASLIESSNGGYVFRHILIQEAAYELILIKTRLALHRRIAETLEMLHAERIEEFAPLIAFHFYTGHDPRSLEYDLLAGEKAARLYANTEAATHFSHALEVAKRTGKDKTTLTKLFLGLGTVLELNSHYEQALQNYDQMQSFGRESGGRSIELSALMAKATLYSIFSRLHDLALSEQLLLQALELSREIDDRASQARLSWNLMITYLFSKRPDQALEHGQLALKLARASGDREQLAFVLNDFGRLYTCRGEFGKAIQAILEARELWQALDHQVMLADSFGSEAEARFNAGEFDLSLKCSQQALQITEKIENLWGQSYDRMLMSFVYLEIGQLGDGIRLAEQSIELADEAGLIASSIGLRSELAVVYASIGAFERGYKLLVQAHQVAEAEQPAWKAYPQAAKIRIHLLQNDIELAVQCARNEILKPISIPYARYTIYLCLANIELAIAKGDHQLGLRLVEDLLDEVTPLTRVDIPEIMLWKGNALIGLGQFHEAYQALTEACALAKKLNNKPQLWLILASLAKISSKLGDLTESNANREEARELIRQIAASLKQVGLSESFMNQPRVQALLL